MRRVALACAAAVLVSASPAIAEAQTMRLGQVLVFYVPELRAGADVKAFESHLNGHILPAWNKATPGMIGRLVRKDRGNRAGTYMVVWTTDTIARHKEYASTSDETRTWRTFDEWLIRAVVSRGEETLDSLHNKRSSS